MKNVTKIEDVRYHRNGVCGNGFTVVLFKMGKRNMVATVFEEKGSVAVLDRDLTAAGTISSEGGNQWRGDYFEDELRAAIQEWGDRQYSKTVVATVSGTPEQVKRGWDALAKEPS